MATQQVDRAQDRERELRQDQQRRDGWLEAHAHLGPQYRQVVRTLAWQRRATGLAMEADRPGYVLEALGPVPDSTRGKRAWRHAAADIEHYRRTYRITDPERALGPEPHSPGQRADQQRVRTAIERVRTKQRATGRSRDPQPTSERTSQPRPHQQRGRPSGSVRPLSQADLQAILAHLGDDPDQLLAGTDADRPVVAVRVRASVGRPGGSAQGRWRRMRAAEWAAWARSLPSRVAATLGVGAVGAVLGRLLAPRLGLLLGALAAVAVGWGLRFQPSSDAVAWRRGAVGERRTARLLAPLERHGWAILHDLAVPGSPANIDHLAIGPGGLFVIDSKQYRGRLQLDASRKLWHGRHPLASALRAVSWEADQAAQVLPNPGMAVAPIVAVHGAQVPWGKIIVDGVPVVPARRLPSLLRQLPAVLGPEPVAALADRARVRFHAAA